MKDSHLINPVTAIGKISKDFSQPTEIEYPLLMRPGMGTENVGPLLRSLVQMVRPARVLEIGAGYTTPFLLEGLANNFRYYDDGNLHDGYFEDSEYEPRLVIIDDMSLGELRKKPGMSNIIDSELVEFTTGLFQGKAERLQEQYGLFDFVWYDCGGPNEYAQFMEEYWPICSHYVLFHFTYSGHAPNKNMEIILDRIKGEHYSRLDIVEPHKKRQGSVTILKKEGAANDRT